VTACIRRFLRRLDRQEGIGLIEAALVGLTAGAIIFTAVKGFVNWGITETKQETPPPNLGGGGPAPLSAPPSNRDAECVSNAYQTQGLIYDAAGNPARFEPPNAMWFIPGIVSGSGSVYTAREVEAKVKHRHFLAKKKWERDCEEERAREDLPTSPSPPTDLRQLYYGTYRLTWIDKTGSASGACPELNLLPTTLTAGSPGESISGIMITFGGRGPVQASLGGDRFNTPGEAESAGFISQLSGTFVERDGRIQIESGSYEFFQGSGSTSLCRITFTGIK
jgi:hypothetical protein